MGKPDMQGYDYCKKHDIFYKPKPKSDKKENRPSRKRRGCPMCQQEVDSSLARLADAFTDPKPERLF